MALAHHQRVARDRKRSERLWAWASRISGVPGLVKVLVAALATVGSVVLKAWVATTGLPLPYQLALATSGGLALICLLGLLLPPAVRRLPPAPVQIGRAHV